VGALRAAVRLRRKPPTRWQHRSSAGWPRRQTWCSFGPARRAEPNAGRAFRRGPAAPRFRPHRRPLRCGHGRRQADRGGRGKRRAAAARQTRGLRRQPGLGGRVPRGCGIVRTPSLSWRPGASGKRRPGHQRVGRPVAVIAATVRAATAAATTTIPILLSIAADAVAAEVSPA
jgi:hypothetical protein